MKNAFRLIGTGIALTFSGVAVYLAFIGRSAQLIELSEFLILAMAGGWGVLSSLDNIVMPDREEKKKNEKLFRNGYAVIRDVSNQYPGFKDEKSQRYFVFEIFANNHELLCRSDEYKSQVGAATGILILKDILEVDIPVKYE